MICCRNGYFMIVFFVFFFKQKTAYEMRISDWSSDVCSSDLVLACFVILYIVLRVLAWISGGPERFRSWRSLRSQKREHELLENGWINVLEGRYRSEEHTSELQSLMRISYAVFCLKKKIILHV